jgi:hypothetical protein
MTTQLNNSTSNLHCGFCFQPIEESLNIHHVKPRSEGGSDHESNLIPAHVECHKLHHSTPKGADGLSDFQRWGKLSALDCHWAFTLRGVKDNPLYEPARQFYRLYYSNPQSRREIR